LKVFPEICFSRVTGFRPWKKSVLFEETVENSCRWKWKLLCHASPFHELSYLEEAGMGTRKKSKIKGIREKWLESANGQKSVGKKRKPKKTGIGQSKKSLS